jgi:hypothetical protein
VEARLRGERPDGRTLVAGELGDFSAVRAVPAERPASRAYRNASGEPTEPRGALR